MNETEQSNRANSTVNHATNQARKAQRQKTSPSPEARPTVTSGNQLASLDLHQPFSTKSSNNSTSAKGGAGNSSSLPGHQSGRSKTNHPRLADQQILNVSDSLATSVTGDDADHPHSSSTNYSFKKNLSTSDLDPFERKKQAALVKVEAKLEKAQRLHQKAHQSVEQEISDFLRVTTIPTASNEPNTSRTNNASYEKRIKTLQDTKKELEKKIASYQSDISRIQAGDIPHSYTSSKDILSNIKSTAVKVAGGSLKHRLTNERERPSTPTQRGSNEQIFSSEVDQPATHPTASSTVTQHIPEANPSSLSSSTSNEVGNSQFYIDANLEHIYEGDKSPRKYDLADGSLVHEHDKSPSANRSQNDDSNAEYTDRISDHSVDDRHATYSSKRNASTTGPEYQQINTKIDGLQKIIDRYESRVQEMQKQLELLSSTSESQREHNERLNTELTDLIDLHQIEMSSMKTDLKNLEDRLVYKFNDYWNEILEKLDKLDTRTAKVEQTQTHSLDTEENTHRIISKLVNILLTVFAIILLLLSTIKNLVQSRVHAMTILILVLAWITFHYLPPTYFQTTVFKNFSNLFKRTARNTTSQ